MSIQGIEPRSSFVKTTVGLFLRGVGSLAMTAGLALAYEISLKVFKVEDPIGLGINSDKMIGFSDLQDYKEVGKVIASATLIWTADRLIKKGVDLSRKRITEFSLEKLQGFRSIVTKMIEERRALNNH